MTLDKLNGEPETMSESADRYDLVMKLCGRDSKGNEFEILSKQMRVQWTSEAVGEMQGFLSDDRVSAQTEVARILLFELVRNILCVGEDEMRMLLGMGIDGDLVAELAEGIENHCEEEGKP